MIVSVFGDVHGNIDLVYKACRDWQRKSQKKIDLILQVGDLGIYGSKDSVDETTKKRIEENPGELNLFHYLQENKYEELLHGNDDLSTIKACLVFVDGNHDDQHYLDQLVASHGNRALTPINDYLLYLKNSTPVIMQNGEQLSYAGVGGIDRENRPGQFEKKPEIAFTKNETTNALQCENVDVFFAHMYPVLEDRKAGSEEMTELIQLIQPKYFFFGHGHKRYEFFIGSTHCYGMNRVQHPNIDNIFDGSMIVFEKKGGKIEILDGA